ncbi:YbaN family protein [Billgrantia endophytica]|uniref:Inner membrane protein n=1 Tax=Billgrantia endophytica TaxID=2033802 RepID=A0A2N7U0A1_9GAMM|nr:YbaN family protein [Halomonas endophytica]PMR73858.1 DUF454 domain-containing protein [Halomonas endophytica]
MHSLRRVAYIALAWVSFILGVIGVFVPLMPTTCFMLLAVWAASRGSPRFASWIREHPRFGPPVVAWEGERAIPRHAKWLALTMLGFSVLILLFTLSLFWLKAILVTGLSLLGLWIASRPEPRGLPAPSTHLIRR